MSSHIYSKDHKLITKRLKQARVDSGLSQLKVAELVDKTQSYISKVESGQRRIDVIQLKKFAGVYKKSLDYFLK